MIDPRITRWAETLVCYSLGLYDGQTLAIQSPPIAVPLIKEVYRAALRAGAHPIVQLSLPELTEILIKEGSEEQLRWLSPLEMLVMEEFDATLTIMAQENTRALSGADARKQTLLAQAREPLQETFMRRNGERSLRWSVTLWPTSAYAQEAEMSLEAFSEFVYEACFLNDPDPVARWREFGREQRRLVKWLRDKREVRVVASGTDLRLSVAGRPFINGDGRRNFPDGELFTSPIEESVTGHITFTLPATYGGRVIEGVRLRFEEGQVVEATADQGQALLDSLLTIDEGARRVGEFAFGTNRHITRGTKNILFDEKLGGSVHLALGRSYPQAGGVNISAIHWDLVCDLRQGGEVWVDDTLMMRDGEMLV